MIKMTIIIIEKEKELTATKNTWLVFENVTARTKAVTLQKSSQKYFWFLKVTFNSFSFLFYHLIIIIILVICFIKCIDIILKFFLLRS